MILRATRALYLSAVMIAFFHPAYADPLFDRTATQWAPYIEWALKCESYEGNPFDVIASTTFVHNASGETHTTGMYYDGTNNWCFRFTGTRPGRWAFTTRSATPALNGHRGVVVVTPNEAGYGFVTHVKNKWARPHGVVGELRAFVPQWVMADGPQAFFRDPERVDSDIRTFLVEHGFTGFHVPVFCRWFDLNQESSRGIDEPVPDSRTFEALELLITKVHAAGGVVHLWMWGDEQRRMTPVRWGINGEADRRLQRYIAARLGPLPGWTMGYGFDLDEWVRESQLSEWRDSMHEYLGWPHMLGARHGDPNRGLDHSSAVPWNRQLDYSSYEHHRPSRDVYVASLQAIPSQPVLSEDRFRIRVSSRYSEKDYSMERTRRGLWHSTMAGGVANIWGNLIGPDGSVDTNRRGSFAFTRPHWIKTHTEFFRERFTVDLEHDDTLTDAFCLRRGHVGCVFYKEDTDSIRMDLSKMMGSRRAVAIDCLKPYAEISVGDLTADVHVWTAPHRSDWALAVGSFDSPSTPASQHASTGRFTNITEFAGTGGPFERGRTGGHGAMFADVDGDERPDLYITMIFDDPMPELFYLNTGGGSFVERGNERGVADFDGGSHGACLADLDNDGDYDLFNGTTWDHPSHPSFNNVFRNDGAGFFRDVTAASGIPQDRRWPTRGVLTFDMDRDGDLDLFCVTNYQGSSDSAGELNEAYRNDGNFQFSPIESGDLITSPCGQGATDTDFDGDGDLDVIAANRTGELNILANDGSGDFTRLTASSLGIRHRATDGITMGDVNADGSLDMVLGDNDVGHLYINDGKGQFEFRRSFNSTDGYMGGLADLDNDGDLDLVFAGDDLSYLNDGEGRFSPGPSIPVAGINDPRGIAFADVDGDGDLDFAIACKRSANQMIRNDLAHGHWLKVRLVSPDGQAGAFGSKVFVYANDSRGRRLLGMREARSNNGYLGQNDPVLHFGLGDLESIDLEVTFLDGTVKRRDAVTANQTVVVRGDTR